jgi:FtsP/CotA-like multicopper oxidase with cupredoxin domain
MAQLGTLAADGSGIPLRWADGITENPALGGTELWEIHNFTADAHPIHLHLVNFQVVDREPFGGAPYPPEPWETGYKDTVIAYPGEITRIRANFDIAGLYVWHCHIVEHEDNEMMRSYCVGTPGVDCPPELF